jgi:hypothetical protein
LNILAQNFIRKVRLNNESIFYFVMWHAYSNFSCTWKCCSAIPIQFLILNPLPLNYAGSFFITVTVKKKLQAYPFCKWITTCFKLPLLLQKDRNKFICYLLLIIQTSFVFGVFPHDCCHHKCHLLVLLSFFCCHIVGI